MTTINRPRSGTLTMLGVACVASVAVTVLALGCGSSPVASSVIADTTAVSVTIIPKLAAVAVNGTVQFRVSGLSPTGAPTVPVVTYSAAGGTITAIGLWTAPAVAGIYRVIATKAAGTVADTAAVTVTAAGATPLLVEDFSTYTSTADMHADPRRIYDREEFGGPWGQWGRIELDTTTGISSIGAGTSTKSMKYTWPDRSNATGVGADAPRCADFYIQKSMTIAPVTELWAEFYVKFSANWTTKAPAAWGCLSNPDYKFIFLGTLPGGRFDLKNDYAGIGTRWDANYPGGGEGDANFVYNVFHDATWHRIRIHSKVSVGGANGIHQIWLDSVLVSSRTALTTTSLNTGLPQTAIYGIKLGNNVNQGPGQVQTLNWGLIRLYTVNPGW